MHYFGWNRDLSSKGLSLRKNFVFMFCVLLLAVGGYQYFDAIQGLEKEKYHLILTEGNRLRLAKEVCLTETIETDGSGDTISQLSPFFFQPVPVNSCTKELLTTISGIGPALAENILSTRNKIHYYRTKEDLLLVPGIGPVRMEAFSRQMSFSLPYTTR